MALVSMGFYLTVQVRDTAGDETTRSYRLTSPDAISAATAVTGFLADLNAVSDAVLARYSIAQRFEENALVLPPGNVNVEELGQLTVFLDGFAAKRATIDIPAPTAAIFVGPSGPDHNNIDGTSILITDFLANFYPAGSFRISDGEAVRATDGFSSGKRIHHGTRKG